MAEGEGFATLSDLEAAGELAQEEFDIPRLGKVLLREISGEEVIELHKVCQTQDTQGRQYLDYPQYMACRAAVCLERPAVGENLKQRLVNVGKIKALPDATYTELLLAVETMCSGRSILGDTLDSVANRLSDLEICIVVLSENGGFFSDLRGKGLNELRDLAAMYREKYKALQRATEPPEGS